MRQYVMMNTGLTRISGELYYCRTKMSRQTDRQIYCMQCLVRWWRGLMCWRRLVRQYVMMNTGLTRISGELYYCRTKMSRQTDRQIYCMQCLVR